MKVSVIIPTYNGRNKVCNILDSLMNQTYIDFEIIVSIDGSTDDTYNYLLNRKDDFVNLVILNNSNGGRSVCRNRGASVATGDLLIFFDDDMRATSTLIDQHVQKHLEYVNSIIVGGTFEDIKKSKTDIQKYRLSLSEKWLNVDNPLLNIPYISAANFSIYKNMFFELGCFDENLKDSEDYDLAITAFEKNINIYLYSELIGFHDDYITCESYIKRLKEYENSQLRLEITKPERYLLKFPFRKPVIFSGIKKYIFMVFQFKLWIQLVDNEYLMVLPKVLRYKIYDVVILSNLLKKVKKC